MKKKTLVILALCLCLLLSWQVSAMATAEPTVSLSEASANRGDEVTIDVNLVDNPGIITMKVSVEYDSEALTLLGRAMETNIGKLAVPRPVLTRVRKKLVYG